MSRVFGGCLLVMSGAAACSASVGGASALAPVWPDARTYVDAHNAVRDAVREPRGYAQAWAPLGQLAWSDEIAQGAQAWAEHLRDTRSCGLVHSDTRYGENLAGGTDIDARSAVALWARERDRYQYSPRYEFDRDTGHYSQLVWRETTHVGCGRALCGRIAVVVCRYSPAGNRIGSAPF